MEELAGLYAMLANDGVLRPLRVTRSATREDGRASPQPGGGVRDRSTCCDTTRGPTVTARSPPRTRWPVAWKTGTSWGFRDAWAAGIAGPYVLAVWIGDFRGQGNPAFVGTDAAAPLFFRIADAVNLARPRRGAAGAGAAARRDARRRLRGQRRSAERRVPAHGGHLVSSRASRRSA